MKLDKAKEINKRVINLLMAKEGATELSDTDVQELKQVSLADMLEASRLLDGQKSSSISSFDKTLAELYLQLLDDEFHILNGFQSACRAINQLRYSGNGHGMLIDGSGNYSFIELNNNRDGAVETIYNASTSSHLFSAINSMYRRLQEAESYQNFPKLKASV